jgi:hypothetical protein
MDTGTHVHLVQKEYMTNELSCYCWCSIAFYCVSILFFNFNMTFPN